MSSVHSALAQVAPLKRYVATADSKLYNAAGAVIDGTLLSGRVLMDMGKTLFLSGGVVLRKVQVLPINSHQAIYSVPTYIHIGDTVPALQKIAALN